MGFSAIIYNGYKSIQQHAYPLAASLKEKKDNYEVVNRVLEIFVATVDLYNMHFPVKILTPLTSSFVTVLNLNYGLGFMSQFYKLAYPVTFDSINGADALEKMKTELKGCFPNMDDRDVSFICEGLLSDQLTAMNFARGQVSYSDSQEFANALANRLERQISELKVGTDDKILVCSTHRSVNNLVLTYKGKNYPMHDAGLLVMDPFVAALRNIKFEYSTPSKLQNGAIYNFLLVDLLSTGLLLGFKAMSLVDTGKIARSIGQFNVFGNKIFNAAAKIPLEVIIRGTLCSACVVILIDFGNKFWNLAQKEPLRDVVENEKMQKEDALKHRAYVISTVFFGAELLFHGASYLQESGMKSIPSSYLKVLSAVARTVGLVCIGLQPKSPNLALLKIN